MATSKAKAKTSSDAQPSLDPVDIAPLHAQWQSLSAQLTADKTSGEHHPQLQLGTICRWVLQECDELEPHMDAICAPFKDAEAKKRRAWLESARQLAAAGSFVDAQLASFRVAREADRSASRDALLKEATGHQASGHAGLTLLVLAGLISEQEAKLIRQGRGALDVARDCQRMGLLYTEHWATLEPAIKLTRFIDVEPLTQASVKRMAAAGDALASYLQRAATSSFKDTAGVDWSHHRVALLARLQQVWEPLRYTALAHAALHGLPDLADRLVALPAMRQTALLYR